MTSTSCCTGKSADGTPCGCQFTQVKLEKQDKNGVFIYCKDNNPRICDFCAHHVALHLSGQVPPAAPPAAAPHPFSDLLSYFSTTVPPLPPTNEDFGVQLPNGLIFPLQAPIVTKNIVFVRECYSTLIRIVETELAVAQRRPGVIFTGPQGNGKTWFSIYLLWYFLSQGREVVYHSAELASTIVITRDPSNGVLNISEVIVKLSMTTIPSLLNPETIFIFDAKAQEAKEPPVTNAFLIETSSRNTRNYAQTMRTDVEFYGIPSYSLTELLGIRHYFNLEENEVVGRCASIGPSFRYVLTKRDFTDVVKRVDDTIKNVDPGKISAYMDDTFINTNAHNDVSACLLKLSVENSTEMEAYKDKNLVWEIASKQITEKLINRRNTDAREFVKKFIAESLDIPKLKGVAGNYFEKFLPEFIVAGEYTMRKLVKPQSGNRAKRIKQTNDEITQTKREKSWKIVNEFTIHKVSDALQSCKRVNTLYNFSGTFPAIDYAAQRFQELFQVTVSARHSIVLEAILAICEFVQNSNPTGIVKLYFAVPSSVYNNYTNWQSFSTKEGERHVQRSLVELPEEVQNKLRNLEQYVIKCDL